MFRTKSKFVWSGPNCALGLDPRDALGTNCSRLIYTIECGSMIVRRPGGTCGASSAIQSGGMLSQRAV